MKKQNTDNEENSTINTRSKSSYQCAIGLAYRENKDAAPTLSVKGAYFDADEIVKVAERFGIPVVEKPELVRGLKYFSEGEEIPEELFEAVAIILNGIELAKMSSR